MAYISNNPNKTRIERKKVPYFNDTQLTLLIEEYAQVYGNEAVIKYLEQKLEYYKVINKEGK